MTIIDKYRILHRNDSLSFKLTIRLPELALSSQPPNSRFACQTQPTKNPTHILRSTLIRSHQPPHTKFPLSSCSLSIASNKLLKFPAPNPSNPLL